MTAADRERWQARWRERAGPPGAPEPFLVAQGPALRPGAVLDLASGDGRNALWLAAQGFRVTALDIAPAALDRLARAAAAEGLQIATRCADLDDPAALASLGPFDDAVVVRYRPSPAQWARLLDRLRPGGILLLCSFGPVQAAKGFRRDYCLVREVIAAELGGRMELLRWDELAQGDDALAGSLWRRRG